MTIGEICLVLIRIRDLYAFAGSKVPAKDIELFCEALAPYGDRPVNLFVKNARNGFAQQPAKSRVAKKNRPTAEKDLPRNLEAIRNYLARLRSAGTNRTAFDEVFNNLKTNKALRLADLQDIARQYSGSVTKHRSISAAHNEISKAFVRQARFENKI